MASRPSVISTRCPILDRVLQGGFPFSRLSLVYGEASTGKTTLATQCSIECASKRLKTLYVDADRSFSYDRLSQLAEGDLESISSYIVLFAPETFAEQTSLIERMKNFVTETTGLIVLDTISSLYRALLGSSEEVFTQHRELNRQLAYLAELASMRNVAVLLVSQVHTHPLRQGSQIEPVAKRILTYWSEVVLKLSPTKDSRIKSAQLEHHYLPNTQLASCLLRMTERGLERAEE